MFRPQNHRLWVLCASLLFLGAPPSGAFAGCLKKAQSAQSQAQASESWQALLERDRRISFTARTEHDARKRLLEPDLADSERATVLMALGCARPEALREVSSLSAVAEAGKGVLREAAILAMGELGVGVVAKLESLLEDPNADARAAAMLALLRSGRKSARSRVDAIAEGSGPDADLARDLLVGVLAPEASQPSEVGKTLFNLRWAAAQRFGLVDGITWQQRSLDQLLARRAFLDGVVLHASATRLELGVADHLMAALIHHQSFASLRAVTRSMPEDLARAIASGLVVPEGPAAWIVILNEIENAGLEARSLELLQLSLAEPGISVRTTNLLVRAGLADAVMGLEDGWNDMTPTDRMRALDAWARLGRVSMLGLLERFEGDSSSQVRASLQITRARLGDILALDALKDVLLDPEHHAFGAYFKAALRTPGEAPIKGLLRRVLPDLEGEDRLSAATGLGLEGDREAREVLATELRKRAPGDWPEGARGVRAVQALRGEAAGLYLDLFVKHFPVEGNIDLNVELALAMLDAKASDALPWLRTAVWNGPFDRSVLASLLVTRVLSIHGLRDELLHPPLNAGEGDFRRVGYALGEWGGLEEVQWLKVQRGLLTNQPVLQGAVLGAFGKRTH
jgi:HEAT repeat protein